MTYGGELRLVDIPTGTDPAVFAQGLGFPGGAGMPPDPMEATRRAFAKAAADKAAAGVRIKTGGVAIDIGSGGVSVDTKKLAKDVERKVDQKIGQYVGGCVFSVFFFVVVGALLLCVGGYVGWQVMKPAGGGFGGGSTVEWDGRSTYTCMGSKEITISGVTARLPGSTGVSATGSCTVTLVDVDIDAEVGVEALGNATIIIQGGHIKGSEAAVFAAANGTVKVEGASIEGKAAKKGNGTISGM